jgi:hypothetical protein
VEGLGDIVVGTRVEARHLVRPAVARGEDENRHLASGAPPLLQHAHAVDDGKAKVEHHRVIGLGIAEEVPFLAILGGIHRIARIRQCRRQLAAEVGIILDDE